MSCSYYPHLTAHVWEISTKLTNTYLYINYSKRLKSYKLVSPKYFASTVGNYANSSWKQEVIFHIFTHITTSLLAYCYAINSTTLIKLVYLLTFIFTHINALSVWLYIMIGMWCNPQFLQLCTVQGKLLMVEKLFLDETLTIN